MSNDYSASMTTANTPKTLTVTRPAVLPALAVCQQARLSRNSRFDGRFFVAVVTTGVYCRPICPARLPAEANVRYFATGAAAVDSGYRPCRRCRPEGARRVPEWTLGSDVVLRAPRMIENGFLNDRSVGRLAAQWGVSERHLNRLFGIQLGTTPVSIARLRRAETARQLLHASSLNITEIAHHAGYRSISRFNHEIRAVFDSAPRELRSGKHKGSASCIVVTLPVRQPYDFVWVFDYLKTRALAGIEDVQGLQYRRLLRREGDAQLWITVSECKGDLLVELPVCNEPLYLLIERVRRLFDLDADGATIHEHLCRDPLLKSIVAARPGLRVPGAWDGFETAVLAILGQQVSVRRGTDLANAMVSKYGSKYGSEYGQIGATHGVTARFPLPHELMDRDIAELGMPGRHGRAISHLARIVNAEEIIVDGCQDFDGLCSRLCEVDGVGPWTANYIRLRVLKDPDAFPDNDWVVLKQLATTASGARKLAQAWQPWRAYALMYLWCRSQSAKAVLNGNH